MEDPEPRHYKRQIINTQIKLLILIFTYYLNIYLLNKLNKYLILINYIYKWPTLYQLYIRIDAQSASIISSIVKGPLEAHMSSKALLSIDIIN